ncbi:CreA family protein [Paraburkholderia strydomiana]|uniref:CreA family protein n=1 Tax=Paraburkholderia strydomiana TaxID=1245417 RepID=UPI0038BC8C54
MPAYEPSGASRENQTPHGGGTGSNHCKQQGAFVKGVTCYVSESHSDGALGSGRITHGTDLTASCHQTGDIRIAETVSRQAQVFTAETDPTFNSLHILRVLDTERHSLVYVTYKEDEIAGGLPARIYVIRLPAGARMPAR